MKHVFLTASLLLASLSVLPSASAEVQCHGPLDGYQYCEVERGTCHAGEEYWSGDVHAHAECRPTDGKSQCGVDVYLPEMLVTYHCFRGGDGRVSPWDYIATSASASEPVDCHGPLDGYQYCEVQLGECHAGETYQAGYGIHAHAECQPTDGKSRCGVDVYASPVVVTRHCAGDEQQVYPVPRAAPAAAAPCTVDDATVEPGYMNVDVDCGPVLRCHFNNIEDGFPPCSSDALGSVALADAGTNCQEYPGYERCEYLGKPCTVTKTHYYHDARTVVEVCGLVQVGL